MLTHFNLPQRIIIPVAAILVAAWLFQVYWGIRTFLDARDDIEKENAVSQALYARFVDPMYIGVVSIFIALESVLQGFKVSWSCYTVVGILLLFLPSILIVIVIRTYELIKIQTSKTA